MSGLICKLSQRVMRSVQPWKGACLSIVLLLFGISQFCIASDTYLVSDRTAGSIFLLQDNNNDGDAFDAGENQLWANGFTAITEIEFYGGAIYAVEEGLANGTNTIVRLQDLNNDGDALDAGERTVWGGSLTNPRGISGDGAGGFFVTDITDDTILRLSDNNNDGDALDAGEQILYAENINGATTPLFTPNGVFVTAFFGDTIHQLTDINNDGDALDIGENVIITPAINEPLGLILDGEGGLFVSSRADDSVYHIEDQNNDGDFLDVAEVLSYADDVFGGLNGSWNMQAVEEGGFLLANYLSGEILRVVDITGDNDALDIGESIPYADGFTRPVDIVLLRSGQNPNADFDEDGDVDGDDFLTWQTGFGTASGAILSDGDTNRDGVINTVDFVTWQRQYGMLAPSTATISGAAVPEPATVATLLLSALGMLAFRRCYPEIVG